MAAAPFYLAGAAHTWLERPLAGAGRPLAGHLAGAAHTWLERPTLGWSGPYLAGAAVFSPSRAGQDSDPACDDGRCSLAAGGAALSRRAVGADSDSDRDCDPGRRPAPVRRHRDPGPAGGALSRRVSAGSRSRISAARRVVALGPWRCVCLGVGPRV
jgi:hypothetical protein